MKSRRIRSMLKFADGVTITDKKNKAFSGNIKEVFQSRLQDVNQWR